MKQFTPLIIASLSLALTACATKTIAPSYVNPNLYTQQSCQTLAEEIRRVETLAAATEKQNTPLSATGIGIGITGGRHGIYPTISMGVGSQSGAIAAKKERLAKLYGEHDAMVIAGRQKGCAFARTIKIYGE